MNSEISNPNNSCDNLNNLYISNNQNEADKNNAFNNQCADVTGSPYFVLMHYNTTIFLGHFIMNLQDLPTTESREVTRELKKYSGTALRILNILIGGATQEQAANAVGVDKSYVSQLCAEEDFKLQIVSGIKTDIEKSVKIDKTLLDIESDLTEKLKTFVPWMTSGDQVIKMLRYVNEAKRKTQHYIPNAGINGSQEGTTGGTTTIIVPTFIQQHFTVTPNREIVGINDQPLVTLSSKQLNTMITTSKTAQLPNPELMKVITPDDTSPKASTKRSKDPWSEL